MSWVVHTSHRVMWMELSERKASCILPLLQGKRWTSSLAQEVHPHPSPHLSLACRPRPGTRALAFCYVGSPWVVGCSQKLVLTSQERLRYACFRALTFHRCEHHV